MITIFTSIGFKQKHFNVKSVENVSWGLIKELIHAENLSNVMIVKKHFQVDLPFFLKPFVVIFHAPLVEYGILGLIDIGYKNKLLFIEQMQIGHKNYEWKIEIQFFFSKCYLSRVSTSRIRYWN